MQAENSLYMKTIAIFTLIIFLFIYAVTLFKQIKRDQAKRTYRTAKHAWKQYRKEQKKIGAYRVSASLKGPDNDIREFHFNRFAVARVDLVETKNMVSSKDKAKLIAILGKVDSALSDRIMALLVKT